MAEVSNAAGFIIADTLGPAGENSASGYREIVLSLKSSAVLAAGCLKLPLDPGGDPTVLLIDDDLAVATHDNAVYRIPGFWPAVETGDIEILEMGDGTRFSPLDFLETFGSPALLDELIYGLEPAATDSSAGVDSIETRGLVDMVDLDAEDALAIIHQDDASVSASRDSESGFRQTDAFLGPDLGLKFNESFTEKDINFSG